MNPNQMAQQIKHKLATVAWPYGAEDVVFGTRSVFVFAGTPTEDELPAGFPFALVTIDSGTPDDEDPELIDQTFSIATVVEVAGDPLGEHAVIGGARASIGTSAGAGVAEVAERVRSAVQRLTGMDGAPIMLSGSGTGAPATLGRGRHMAFDSFTAQGLCTSQPYFSPPQELRYVGDTWSWKGQWCVDRFDFENFTLAFIEGITPAASFDDIDGIVWTGTNLEVVEVAVPGRVYHMFGMYNDRGASDLAASPVVVGSYLAI